ncbi:hypothetical protein [Bacillus sp. MRMR6]|uniref:hypothetical protein n=1 Tax=Bacillus sp. MRMR6 TaxID=1928617 RepID=UPI00158ED9AB|nr:hypothetical protein [Bacillus sp. MRMR6]
MNFENCLAPGAIGSRSKAHPSRRLKSNLHAGWFVFCWSSINGRLPLFYKETGGNNVAAEEL